MSSPAPMRFTARVWTAEQIVRDVGYRAAYSSTRHHFHWRASPARPSFRTTKSRAYCCRGNATLAARLGQGRRSEACVPYWRRCSLSNTRPAHVLVLQICSTPETDQPRSMNMAPRTPGHRPVRNRHCSAEFIRRRGPRGAHDGLCRVEFPGDRRDGVWAYRRHSMAVARLSQTKEARDRLAPRPVCGDVTASQSTNSTKISRSRPALLTASPR